MIESKYLQKLKNFFDSGIIGAELAEVLLYTLASNKKLPGDGYDKREIRQTLHSLRRYKFVRHVRNDNGVKYLLTPKGESRLRNFLIDTIEIKKQKHWDGKWHMVIFDFPIKFKKVRDAFRWKLKELGFFQLQKSVWVSPYACETKILFVADFFGVGKHIEILEINKILNDWKLKNHFGFN